MSLLSKLYEGGWNVAYRHIPAATILDERTTPFSLIPNTWRSWAADPFVYTHEGTTYVFAELFDYLTRKGAIGTVAIPTESGQNGKLSSMSLSICLIPMFSFVMGKSI
jgi:hypothetical protein